MGDDGEEDSEGEGDREEDDDDDNDMECLRSRDLRILRGFCASIRSFCCSSPCRLGCVF